VTEAFLKELARGRVPRRQSGASLSHSVSRNRRSPAPPLDPMGSGATKTSQSSNLSTFAPHSSCDRFRREQDTDSPSDRSLPSTARLSPRSPRWGRSAGARRGYWGIVYRRRLCWPRDPFSSGRDSGWQQL
jgi:hypothetical protein